MLEDFYLKMITAVDERRRQASAAVPRIVSRIVFRVVHLMRQSKAQTQC